jgi:murein DD-endopeptidase MepM/ murein hydrolase activator NlpD
MRAAEVSTTLFAAIDAAGIPDEVVEQVAEIFGHKIDFWRQVRRGAQLRVVYETVQLEGSLEAPRAGRVLAAEFVSGGRRHQALWFERGGGRGEYFGFDGKSLRQGFLQAPLEYTRISSGFSLERMHPVWNDLRAHKGIDYAAPIGTKVRTVGDGVVDFIGQQRGYGNVVVVRHDNDVTTLYAHLNDFAPQLQLGQTVRQGDLIGEVGVTGWATGPHLHFEFRVKGEHVDPQTVDLPGVRPLDGAERERYQQALAEVRHRLGLLDTLRVARFE